MGCHLRFSLYVTVLSEDCAKFHFVRHFCCLVISVSASKFKDHWCESLWFLLFPVLYTRAQLTVSVITEQSDI